MQSLRVSGGGLRGRRLRFDVAGGVRPTSERARQAYFNIVADELPDSRFLDLYAGSGIFSFEAVSRGASEALAIDLSRKNAVEITQSAEDWDVPVRVEVLRLPDDLKRLESVEPFDLVYADPPYDFRDYAGLLEKIDSLVPLSNEAIVAIEHRSKARPDVPEQAGRLSLRRTTRYGNVSITFFDLRVPNDDE